MPARTGTANWSGNLVDGKGHVKLGSGAFEGSYDWRSRSGDGAGTNPEELIAAAHAGCYAMALSHLLSEAGHVPTSVNASAKVHLEKVGDGFEIPLIELSVEAVVPGVDKAKFHELAEGAKAGCPVSKALKGPRITLTATLK
jgi:osmotically inducible protein OsmC